MKEPIRGVDHVFLTVRDLDAAAERYRRLGFTVSERGFHSAAKGSANHTIVFRDDYLELLGFVAETSDNADRRAALERDGDALEGIALKADDARAAADALEARGIAVGSPGDFERPVVLPDGTRTRAAFTTVAVAARDAPVGHVFVCGHHTPETVWRPDLTVHPNGAVGLAGLVILSDRGEAVAQGFARMFDTTPTRDAARTWQVDTGSIPIEVIDGSLHRARYAGLDRPGAGWATRVAALRVAVDDLDRAADALRAPFVRTDGPAPGLFVSAEAASGVVLEFVPT